MTVGSGLARHRAHLTLGNYPRRLGAVSAGGLVSSGAAIGTTSIASSIGAGAAAGPIGAAVGAVVGLIMTLWSAHEARAKGARTENAAVASAVQAFDGSLKAIFSAANSGSIGASDAITLCNQVMGQYWQSMAPYQVGPGRADGSRSGSNCPGIIAGHAPQCNKTCTAGCCVGCMDLYQSIQQCVQVFQAGGGTAQIYKVFGDHYGLTTREGYTLVYTPPAGSTGTMASVLGVSGSTVAGIPTWLLVVIGGGALLWYESR